MGTTLTPILRVSFYRSFGVFSLGNGRTWISGAMRRKDLVLVCEQEVDIRVVSKVRVCFAVLFVVYCQRCLMFTKSGTSVTH